MILARIANRIVMALIFAGIGAMLGVVAGAFLSMALFPPALAGVVASSAAMPVLMLSGTALGATAGIVIALRA